MKSSASKPQAILSVSDKTGIVEFALGLERLGFHILSTGGTACELRENGVRCEELSDYIEYPEVFGGRVKTLHPKVYGGILFDRNSVDHREQVEAHGIRSIDLICVNLYPFQARAVEKSLPLEQAIEFIDIGGPTMLRAAAKNYRDCLPVCDVADYERVLDELTAAELRGSRQSVDRGFRIELAKKCFARLARYNQMISDYYARELGVEPSVANPPPATPQSSHQDGAVESTDVKTAQLQPSKNWNTQAVKSPDSSSGESTAHIHLALDQEKALRYGENPHQQAGFFVESGSERKGLATLEQLSGKDMSFNNFLDVEAATSLVRLFGDQTGAAACVVKHNNPCGVATGSCGLAQVFTRALQADAKSAFGGIVVVNEVVDKPTAEAMSAVFLEVIVAPGFDQDALAILQRKPNLRLLKAGFLRSSQRAGLDVKAVDGGYLLQEWDQRLTSPKDWAIAGQVQPTSAQLVDLEFAWKVCKSVKSNAIVLAHDQTTLAIGAGQMSRIDAFQLAARLAGERSKSLKGAVLASDGFLPFKDTVEYAAEHGIAAIVQPGGSKRDQESIEAANRFGLAMAMTGMRHFRH